MVADCVRGVDVPHLHPAAFRGVADPERNAGRARLVPLLASWVRNQTRGRLRAEETEESLCTDPGSALGTNRCRVPTVQPDDPGGAGCCYRPSAGFPFDEVRVAGTGVGVDTVAAGSVRRGVQPDGAADALAQVRPLSLRRRFEGGPQRVELGVIERLRKLFASVAGS